MQMTTKIKFRNAPKTKLTIPTLLSVLALSITPFAAQAQAVDCEPGIDANGDGYDDRLISPLATLISSEVDCFSTVKANAIIRRARLEDAIVGEGAKVLRGAVIAYGQIGDNARISRDVTISGGPAQRPIVGAGVIIRTGVVFTDGNSDGFIGNDSIIRANAMLEGVILGQNTIVGRDVKLDNTEAGDNTRFGPRASVEFESTIGADTVIGRDVTIGFVNVVGDNVIIRSNTITGEFVDIGDDVTIRSGVSIGDFATVGEGVVVGANATILANADVPAFTVITRDSVYPADGAPEIDLEL